MGVQNGPALLTFQILLNLYLVPYYLNNQQNIKSKIILSPEWGQIYKKGAKILLFGSFPPPIGGVSIHVKRLFYLLKEKGYRISLVDLGKNYKLPGLKWLLIFFKIMTTSFDILHVHRVDEKTIKIISWCKRLKSFKLYVTLHNERLFSKETNLSTEILNRYFSLVDTLIVVGSHIVSDVEKNISAPLSRIIVKNSFIPPILSLETTLRKELPEDLLSFIASRQPVINSSAFKINFFEGVDLYGLDLCVELVRMLKEEYPNIGFVFAIAAYEEAKEYQNKINLKIKEYNLEANFFFLKGQHLIWPSFRLYDLTVRPTYRDGFGITVAESLAVGCPVVASDVCNRAEGTIIFKNRDLEDFYKKCLAVLKRSKNEC